jgi:hypothetical protein
MFRSDLYSKIISKANIYDESEFPVCEDRGLDWLSEETYNILKEKYNMTKKKKKKKIVKKKKKTKKKRK